MAKSNESRTKTRAREADGRRKKFAFIRHGVESKFVLEETAMYPRVTGTFRKLPFRARVAASDRMRKLPDDVPLAYFDATAKELAAVVMDWDIIDETGASVAVTHKNIAALEPGVLNALIEAVFSFADVEVEEELADADAAKNLSKG